MSIYDSSTMRLALSFDNKILCDVDLAREVGIRASVVYGAIVNHARVCWLDENKREWIIKNDFFFYWKNKNLSQTVGCDISSLRPLINKLIKFGVLEKKLDRIPKYPNEQIPFYRIHPYQREGGMNSPPRGDELSPHNARNDSKNIKDKNKGVAPLRGLLGGSKRTSIPGENNSSSKERPRGVSEREYQYTKLIDEKIRTNRGGKYSSKEIEDRVWNGSKELHKLIKIEGYTFEQVRDVLDWAATNTFWKANFQSVARVRSKKDRDSDIKFRNMYSAFVLEQEKNAPIEEKIRNVITDELRIQDFDSRTEYEERIEAHCEDVFAMKEKLDQLSKEVVQKGKSPITFHNTNQILKMIPFIVWLGDQVYGGVSASVAYSEARHVLQPYLRYIGGKIDKITVGSWLFDEKSPDFHKFLKDYGIKHMLRRYRNDRQ